MNYDNNTTTSYRNFYSTTLMSSMDSFPPTPARMHILSDLCRCQTVLLKSKLENVINDVTLSDLKLDVLLSMCLLIDLHNRNIKQTLNEYLNNIIIQKISELMDAPTAPTAPTSTQLGSERVENAETQYSTIIREHIDNFINEYYQTGVFKLISRINDDTKITLITEELKYHFKAQVVFLNDMDHNGVPTWKISATEN